MERLSASDLRCATSRVWGIEMRQLLHRNDLHGGTPPDPAGRRFVAWSDDTQRTFQGVERHAVKFVGEQDFAVGEVGIDFSHGEDDLVAVGGLHQQHFG